MQTDLRSPGPAHRSPHSDQLWGSGWGFSKRLERETPFFGTAVALVREDSRDRRGLSIVRWLVCLP